jgi:hypothetical protein
MGNQLTHEGDAFINFRDFKFRDERSHGFRWVSTKHLRFPAGSVGDRELLAALVRHEKFRDDYARGGVLPEGLRHGPYWLRLVTPDVYETVALSRSSATRLAHAVKHTRPGLLERLRPALRPSALRCYPSDSDSGFVL